MFTDKEKEIYILPHTNLGVDPLAVRRKLILASKNKLEEWINIFNTSTDDLEVAEVEEKISNVAREAFGLGSLTDSNLTDATVLEYLATFLEWLSTPSETRSVISAPSRPCTGCRQPS